MTQAGRETAMDAIELVRFWLPDEDAPEAHLALDRIERVVEAARTYIIEVSRAPNHWDEAEADASSRELIESLGALDA